MSKRLLSAILAIAMVASLCASVFTVGTSAATNYESDRDALKKAIVELFKKGPTVNEAVIEYLTDAGVLTVVKDCNGVAVTTQEEIDRNAVFSVADAVCTKCGAGHTYAKAANGVDGTDVEYFLAKDSTLIADYAEYVTNYDLLCAWAGLTTLGSGSIAGTKYATADSIALRKITTYILIYAASAYYFGDKADELLVDASFNEGRNDIVKAATKMVKNFIADLADEAGEYEAKPAKYAAAYEAWVKQYHTGTAYNPNFGVNPYGEYEDILANNEWSKILQGYVASFPRWFSFAEMRADANVAPKLVAFERAYREAQTYTAKDVLYYDFMTGSKKTGLEKAWKDLCEALLAQYKWDEFEFDTAATEVTAYNTMKKVVAFYDKYIADAYLNIYTSANQALLSNIAMAKLVEKFAGTDTMKIYAIGAEYFNKLTSDIVAGLAALDPAAAQLALTAGDIDSAVKAINEAQALLNGYAIFAGLEDGDYRKTAWNNLKNAIADLKVLIPYDAVSPCVYTIVAAEDNAVVKDFDKETELKANNEVVITFMPNYFAFIRFEAAFQDALVAMASAIDGHKATIDKLGAISVSKDLAKSALKDALLDLDFLAGQKLSADDKGVITADTTFGNIYYRLLYVVFYPEIVSGRHGDNLNIDDDQAAEQAEYFRTMFNDAIKVYETGKVDGTVFSGVEFNSNSWDWKTESISGEKNGYAAIAKELYDFLPYLTAELEQLINYYAFITEIIADYHFGVTAFAADSDADFAAAGFADYQNASYYVGYNVKKGVANAGEYYEMAMAALKVLTLCEINVDAGDYADDFKKEDYKVTSKALIDAYNAFLKEVDDLLTERGQKLVDQFIDDVNAWVSTSYEKTDYDNDHELYDKLWLGAWMEEALALPTHAAESYLYYNFTLKSIADSDARANKYAAGEQFKATIYNPLVAKSGALADYTDVVKYDREWAEDFAEVRELAGYVLTLINEAGTNVVDTDMPLYYVLNVIAKLDAVLDTQDEHTLDVIEAYKAEVLYPVLAVAELNKFDYDATAEGFADVWAAYEKAYNDAIAAKYDGRMPKADIEDAAANLSAAVVLLADFAKAEGSATKADLEALIVAAEALLARADDVDTAAKLEAVNALKAAIPAAKQFLVGYNYNVDYNNSNDIDAAVAALQAAIDAVDEALYFADDLTAYLTIIAANNAGYEAMNTAESYAALVLAWSNAAEVAQNANLNASAYIAAADAVKAAVEALEAKPAPVEPEEPAMTKTFEAAVAKLAELKAVSTEGFTAESVSAFNEAVARLEIAIKTVAEDDVLLEFIANAYIAKAQLATIVVENPTTCD